MKQHIATFIFFLFTTVYLPAQQTPAAAQSQPILVTGATAHLGNGQVIENSAIAFERGKLTIVADARTIRIDGTKNFKTIDATGKHIYPGFIAPNTQLGLTEIGAVRATRDNFEIGSLNPNLRAIIAYNTDSDVTPTIRSNGVLMAQIVPSGGRISGQSSIVGLDAWNWEDAAYATDEGIHLNWPNMFSRRRGSGTIQKNENYNKQKKEFEDLFKDAQAYAKKRTPEEVNLKLEAMRGLFDKSKTLYVHTHDVKTMTEAILFAESYDVKLVLVGARESWMMTDLLKEKNIPIILNQVHSLPSKEDEDIDQPFRTPALLQDAGVQFCFSISGSFAFWQQRNLPFQAGHAVGFGLAYEAAVSALTLQPATILGIDKTTGSLETGKDATLFISEGDALDMRTCKVTEAFIQGKEIDLDNKQKALYRKFKKKYE